MVIIAEIINHGISWDHIWVNLRSTSLRPHYSKKARPSHFFEGLWYVSFISGPWTCPHLAAAGGWHDRLFRSVNCSNLFQTMMRLCLIGGLEHVFFHVLGIIIPIDFHIFQTGWNHQPVYEFPIQVILLQGQSSCTISIMWYPRTISTWIHDTNHDSLSYSHFQDISLSNQRHV